MTVGYRSHRLQDPELRERLVVLARERHRFGYSRMLILLRREGFVVNHRRLFRIYWDERAEGAQERRAANGLWA